METQFPQSWSFRAFTWFTLTMLLLAGCSTYSFRTQSAPIKEYNSANEYLSAAQEAPPILALAYQLKAANLCIRRGEINEALQILRETHAQSIDISIHKTILTVRLALLQKDRSRARYLLKSALDSVQRQYFDSITQSTAVAPLHIGLLLTSKGPHSEAAKMVQDGFLAAYYQDLQKRPSDTTVKLYDTGDGSQLREAYHKAMQDKVNFIVGPLTKPELQTIAKIRINVPVLALNTLPDRVSLPRELYQFGLMPEDEVIAVAKYALRQGKQRALIFAHQSEWGERLAQTFKYFWESNHGLVVDMGFFKPGRHLEEKVRTLLKADETSRRQDVDMIFIAASPEAARQIKPLFNLHFAGDLPVYATSSVYGGMPMPNQDQNLNGIRFCDMPWILQPSSQIQDTYQAMNNLSKKPNQFPRFFALGMDAYQLATQMGKSNQLPAYGISGYTGNLHLNNYQRIERGLVCAKFEHGIPVPDY